MVGRPAAGCVRATPPEKGRKKVDADTATTRKPMLLLRLFGLFLLRNEAAALSTLLFHEPPRKTRPGRLTREPRADAVYHKAPAREISRAVGGQPPTPPGQSSESRAPERRAKGTPTPQPPENRSSRNDRTGRTRRGTRRRRSLHRCPTSRPASTRIRAAFSWMWSGFSYSFRHHSQTLPLKSSTP